MDWFLIVVIGVIFLIVLVNILLFILNDYMYPSLKSDFLSPGIAQSGRDTTKNGYDGYQNPFARIGLTADNGKTSLEGRKGHIGGSGSKGKDGQKGSSGFSGAPGEIGEKGLPSNSIVPVLNLYDINNLNAYSLTDGFTFDNKKYQVTMHSNIENNSRFVLNFGEDFVNPQPGYNTTLTFDSNDIPLEDLEGGAFYSNLRFAIGYGTGTSKSTNRSDDVIFYVSPPISRKSYLFRYKLPKTIPSEFENIDSKYPIKPLNNSKNFFFFETITANNTHSDLTLWKCHLVHGLAKYEMVVNTFPPLTGKYNFNYRIIEEFTLKEDTAFNLPQVVFPFNTDVLMFNKKNDTYLTISNRFDLNKVVERDYSFDKVIWNQTNKKNVEAIGSAERIKVSYENAYVSLHNDLQLSKAQVGVLANFDVGGAALLQSSGSLLNIKGNLKYNFLSLPIDLALGMRNYTPGVPLDKFENIEKLYLRIPFNPINFSNINAIDYIYGDEYSLDLIDFRSVYGKNIFLSTAYLTTLDGSGNPTTMETIIPPNPNPYLFTSFLLPVEVGYTTYSTKELYTTLVMLQKHNNYSYILNIPLYGYKKK